MNTDPAGVANVHIHRYRARCSWQGSTGVGYEHYGRGHTVSAPPAAGDLALSSDPAFRGDPARMNPEGLLVMAAASCQLLSFLAVAARARLDVVSYEDDAEAEMPEDDKPVRITSIRLRPRITLRLGKADEARVRQLVDLAHRECYIANSLRTEIVVEPTVVWLEAREQA